MAVELQQFEEFSGPAAYAQPSSAIDAGAPQHSVRILVSAALGSSFT